MGYRVDKIICVGTGTRSAKRELSQDELYKALSTHQKNYEVHLVDDETKKTTVTDTRDYNFVNIIRNAKPYGLVDHNDCFCFAVSQAAFDFLAFVENITTQPYEPEYQGMSFVGRPFPTGAYNEIWRMSPDSSNPLQSYYRPLYDMFVHNYFAHPSRWEGNCFLAYTPHPHYQVCKIWFNDAEAAKRLIKKGQQRSRPKR